jgi:hypothetical protein
MRRSILALTAAAAALLPLSVLSTASAAPAKTHDVLTTGKVGGANVKVKDVLQASLASKSAVVIADGTTTLKCTTSTFTVKVTKNPSAKGTADESLTKQSFSKCSATGPYKAYITSVTISLAKPPYKTTTSDKKNDPVTVSGAKSKVVVVTTLAGTLTCYYSGKTVTGSASNKHQTISFSKQKLTLASGSSSDCSLLSKTAEFSATYGPVVDTSVKGKTKPHVFVN